MKLKAFVKAVLNDVMDAIQETIKERKRDNKHGYVNLKSHNLEEMEVDTIALIPENWTIRKWSFARH